MRRRAPRWGVVMRLILPTTIALTAAMTLACSPPVESTCRCLGQPGGVSVELAATGLGTYDGAQYSVGDAVYRMDLAPDEAADDDPRVFPEAQVAGLVEIELLQQGADWLRLYLPQDEQRRPLGADVLDHSTIRSPFVGGVIDGRIVQLDTVEVTLDAWLADHAISGTFQATDGVTSVSGQFSGETAMLCRPADPRERDNSVSKDGWLDAPYQGSDACLTLVRTIYGAR